MADKSIEKIYREIEADRNRLTPEIKRTKNPDTLNTSKGYQMNFKPTIRYQSANPKHKIISGNLDTRVTSPKGLSFDASIGGNRETLKVPGKTLSRGGFGINSFGIGYQKGGFKGGVTLDPKSGKVLNAGFKVTKYF